MNDRIPGNWTNEQIWAHNRTPVVERPTTPCCLCKHELGIPWTDDPSVPECASCCHVCAHDGRPFHWRIGRFPERFAAELLATAITQKRAGELLECLFEGGSCTLQDDGELVLVSGSQIQMLISAAGE